MLSISMEGIDYCSYQTVTHFGQMFLLWSVSHHETSVFAQCTSSDLSLFSYHETYRGTSSDFAQSICYQSQWRGLITAQRVCIGSSTDRGTLKGTVHLRSMTWHISCHGGVLDLALFTEHLRSMTWHISCHGDKGSSTVRGTSLLALFIWGLWLDTYLVMVWYGI
jgi:hypothetical protein